MDQPSGQRSNVHHQGGSWREMGNSYQRRYGTGRASGGYSRDNDRQGNQWNNRGNFGGQYNRGNDSRGNQWITRGNYRQENRQHHQEYRPQRGGFDNPPINQKPNAQQQEDRAEAQSLDNFNDKPTPSELFLDILTKEEREALLNKKMEEIRNKNDALRKRHELIQLAKEKFKENDVKSTMCIEEEEFPNSSDFVYDLGDSTSSLCTVQEDSTLGQRFDQNVKVSKVSIDYANMVQDGKGKKKKNKKSKGDREKEDGAETQKKKDKTEIDETAVEDAEQNLMFNEKMKVDAPTGSRALNVDASSGFGVLGVKATSGSGALGKLKDDYPNFPPNNWEDEEKFVDAILAQEPEEQFVDAGPDVIVKSYEETITIDEPDISISAIDYLMEKDVVAVHVELSEDGFRRIACVTEDKSYIFEVENNPYLMSSGKVAEFFNLNQGPTKVFHGLDSKTCAVFFHNYDIILDGTKIYDLKIAFDMMREYGLGDMTKLKKTGFSPDCILVDTDNVTTVCLTYIRAYQYFSQEINREMKDYKKQLFEIVRAEIDKEKLKTAKERKKKECKAANIVRLSHSGQTSKSKKQKRKMDFPVHQLASELKEKEITNGREEKLENIPSSDSASSKNFTAAEQLPENCNSAINLQAASAHPSLNNTLQQEFNETRQMARQCATQKSQEEQCQVIAVVKHESVDFPDGRRYTCRSTVVPDPVIVEGKSTGTQTESDKCKDVGVQCEIIDWNKYQKMIELAEVVLR